MFTPIYLIIGVFAVGSITFAVLGLLMDRGSTGTGRPATAPELWEAA